MDIIKKLKERIDLKQNAAVLLDNSIQIDILDIPVFVGLLTSSFFQPF